MKFEIIGDKESIKACLDEFIEMAEKEYNIQKEKIESKLKVFGVQVGLPEFKMGYFEEGEKIILFNTFPVPKSLSFLMKSSIKKMEKNLVNYFKERGVKAEVKFIGE